MKTPYQRWQKRTQDGKAMAAGWVSKKYVPSGEGEYEVRGHPRRSTLTWAHGHWWYMHTEDCGGTVGIPYWHCEGDKRYVWKRKPRFCAAHIHWADLLLKAVTLDSESAKAELREMGWKGDYNPYAEPGMKKDWLHK